VIAPMARGLAQTPRISVVVPSFNQGRFIGRTIASVLAQAHVHDVHVFDGGSTDETIDVLRSFGSAIEWDSRADAGQAAAVNKGITSARGDIIAWINSDDTYAPDAFATVAGVFTTRPEVGVVYGEGFHIDEQDNVIERYPTEDFAIPRLLETCFLCQPATFFRRETVERHGALRESLRYCMDYELWLRLAIQGVQFERINAFLANTRFYQQTKTLAARPQAYFEAADMLVQCFGGGSGPWIDHFSHIVTQDFAKPAGGAGHRSFDRIRTLARSFWHADAITPGPDPERTAPGNLRTEPR
jgi:glycosyltransferase involved in cell wall biosynthesis